MAKVLVEDGWLEVRVSWLERALLSEKARRVPLSSVESVDARPALLDMLLYWTDQRGVWLGGATSYGGYLVPSTRNPNHTIAIQVTGQRLWFVELDEDQGRDEIAARITCSLSNQARTAPRAEAQPPRQVTAIPVPRVQHEEIDPADDETAPQVAQRQLRLTGVPDLSLSRLGSWLVALGVLGVLAGTTAVTAGMVPGLLAVGAGLACAIIGGLALAATAHHPS